MRNKFGKKATFLLMASLSLAFLAGCQDTSSNSAEEEGNNSSEEIELEDGTYNATAQGYGGELAAEVVVESGEIKDIEVLEHEESSPVYSRAFPVIKERILNEQSPDVDTVSAATFTSYAVKSAVADALKEAGHDFGEIEFATETDETEKSELEDVDTQLVIVGGGPAGLSSAISAKQAGVTDVILIEKLDILSGNGKFDMNFFDMINSKAQKDNGQEITAEDFMEMKEDVKDSDERVEAWAEENFEIDQWLRDMDIELNYPYGETNHMAEEDEYAGEHIQEHLEKTAYDLGVDIRTGTKGLDLIMDGNKTMGVKVENKEGYYNINADAVVVATGGFSANDELLEEYAPGAEIVETSNQMGATGDFIEVFKKHDIKLDHMDDLSVFKTIITNRRDLTGGADDFILVNKNGERFIDENESGLEFAHTILDQEGEEAYYLYDQEAYESFYRLQKHVEEDYHTKADTLEELAEELGIDGDRLIETIEQYNAVIENGEEDPFRGEEISERKFAEEGPFYGVPIESAIHMTKGGVVANEKAQIINNSDEPVEGLYAAGEVTDTSGAYSASVIFGKISGREAGEYILEQ